MVTYPDLYDVDLFKLAVMHISGSSERYGLRVLAEALGMDREEFTASFITGDAEFSAQQQQQILNSLHIPNYSKFYQEGDKAAQANARAELAKAFGKELKELRVRMGKTQEELASEIHINPYLVNIFEENGYLLSAGRADKQSFNHIFKLIATHVNDPAVSAAFQKIQDFENRPAANIVESIRTTPLIGTAKQIEEKPIKDLLVTKFIKNFGTMNSQNTENKTR